MGLIGLIGPMGLIGVIGPMVFVGSIGPIGLLDLYLWLYGLSLLFPFSFAALGFLYALWHRVGFSFRCFFVAPL